MAGTRDADLNRAAALKLAIRREGEEAASPFPPLLTEAQRIAQTVAAGLHGRRRAGPGETFWQHRPYASGDPVSMIDWRQSARAADRLYVRQNEWEAAAAVWIWRDASRSLDYSSAPATPTKRRRADVLAAALAILLAEAGERVGVLGGADLPFHGRQAPTKALEALRVDEFNRDDSASPPPETPVGPHARIVMLSDFLTELSLLEGAVARYASSGAGGVLVHLVDAAEETFPFAGRTEFHDLESSDRLTVGDAGAMRASYRAAFDGHRADVEAMARRNGWRFLSHRTDQPAATALLALYSALSADGGLVQAASPAQQTQSRKQEQTA